MAEFHWRSGVDGGTLTPLDNLAGHGCDACGLLIPKTWDYCRPCGEELWAIALQGPRSLAWWYGEASGQPNHRRPLPAGPYGPSLGAMPELELRAAWGDR